MSLSAQDAPCILSTSYNHRGSALLPAAPCSASTRSRMRGMARPLARRGHGNGRFPPGVKRAASVVVAVAAAWFRDAVRRSIENADEQREGRGWSRSARLDQWLSRSRVHEQGGSLPAAGSSSCRCSASRWGCGSGLGLGRPLLARPRAPSKQRCGSASRRWPGGRCHPRPQPKDLLGVAQSPGAR